MFHTIPWPNKSTCWPVICFRSLKHFQICALPIHTSIYLPVTCFSKLTHTAQYVPYPSIWTIFPLIIPYYGHVNTTYKCIHTPLIYAYAINHLKLGFHGKISICSVTLIAVSSVHYVSANYACNYLSGQPKGKFTISDCIIQCTKAIDCHSVNFDPIGGSTNVGHCALVMPSVVTNGSTGWQYYSTADNDCLW